MFNVMRSFFLVVLLAASLVSAEVTVKFSNMNLFPNTTNEVAAISLLFLVDDAGNVWMDASTAGAHQTLRDAVNAWDGPVGTISYAGAFNTSFLLEIRGWGGTTLNLCNHEGGCLGIGLQSAWRIDRPGFEYVEVTAAIGRGSLDFRSVLWTYRSSLDASMVLTCPGVSITNSLPTRSGRLELAGQNIRIGDTQALRLESVFPGPMATGYGLAGFSFDVMGTDGSIAPPAEPVQSQDLSEKVPAEIPKPQE